MLRELYKLFKVIGGGIKFILLLILRSPFNAVSTIILASFIQCAFTDIQKNDKQSLVYTCVAFGISNLLLFMYNGSVWIWFSSYVIKLEGKLRRVIFGKISTISLSQIEQKSHGEWITRLNTDVQMPFSKPIHLPHACCAIVSICVSSGILIYKSPYIFGLVMLFILPHIVISQLCIARPMTALTTKSLEVTANNTSDLNIFITCADTISLYDARGFVMKRFGESSLQLRRVNMKKQHRNALGSAILPLFGMGGYLVILLISSAWIASGQMSFGELTSAFQHRGGLLMGFMMLINCIVSIKESEVSMRRINETLDIKSKGM